SALVPEDLVADRVHGAVAERGVDRAILVWIRPAVRVVMMHELVHVAADELGRAPAEQRLGRRVHGRRRTFVLDAVDAFAGGLQDQLILALDVAEEPLRALPFREPARPVAVRLRVDAVPMLLFEIEERQQDQPAAVRARDPVAAVLNPELALGGMARRK